MTTLAAQPDSSTTNAGTPLRPLALAPARLPPGVFAKVGETFASGLSALQRALAALAPATPDQQGLLDAARGEIGRLESLGVRVQEFARVVGGDAPLPCESIALARAVRETLAAWSPAARVAGVTLAAGEPCDVEVNAAVLEQLLNLALECALQTGPAIAVAVGGQGRPVTPLLTIEVDRAAGASGDAGVEDFGDLYWMLFSLLARAVGLSPRRLAVGHVVTLALGFPPAPAALRAEAATEGLPRTPAATGRHVLLIEPREMARIAAHDLMDGAGMRVDSAASLVQARESLRDGAPDVVVSGIPVGDAAVAALLDELRAAQPRLRVIELVDDDNAFAFSVPGSDHPAQVGRHDMTRTLVAAVAQELDAAWAS